MCTLLISFLEIVSLKFTRLSLTQRSFAMNMLAFIFFSFHHPYLYAFLQYDSQTTTYKPNKQNISTTAIHPKYNQLYKHIYVYIYVCILI